MSSHHYQLISYIAPAAPATRRPYRGELPFLRPEIGFTPNWYHRALGIDFGENWHTEPAYRRETVLQMRSELSRRFPGTGIAGIDRTDAGADILTGTFGACCVAGIYNLPLIYSDNNWPATAHQYLTDSETDNLIPPLLDDNAFFSELIAQTDWIAENEGRVEGYINWQGVLNNAHRLRGPDLFLDILAEPHRARHLFDCVTETMVTAAKRLHARQRDSGFQVDFFTMSNCLVNLVSPEHYTELLLPYDQRIAHEFPHVGIHNCAWNADPYLHAYANVPKLRYIDMGQDSDLSSARALFPDARRAIMYMPQHLAQKSSLELKADLARIAMEYGPCDIIAADIEAGTPDDRVWELMRICEEIGADFSRNG
jgi:hypothetical protein